MGCGPLARGLILAAAVTGAAACADTYDYHGLVLDPPSAAPPIQLVEHGGQAFDLNKQRGRLVLLYFGYTNCPDVCPLTLSNWARVKRQLGRRAEQVRFVFVSVDPARDTPAIVQAYARRFDPGFVGLTGNEGQISAIERSYMSASYRDQATPKGDYNVMHGTRSFLVDPEGLLRVLYPPETTPEQLEADIRHVLR